MIDEIIDGADAFDVVFSTHDDKIETIHRMNEEKLIFLLRGFGPSGALPDRIVPLRRFVRGGRCAINGVRS